MSETDILVINPYTICLVTQKTTHKNTLTRPFKLGCMWCQAIWSWRFLV